MPKQRRLRILPQNEVDDLFSCPVFTDDERSLWFDLNEQEQKLLDLQISVARKVDLILQLGYFKYNYHFFGFTFASSQEDTNYVMSRYFQGIPLIKSALGREAKRLNQFLVLKELGFTLFNKENHIPLLLEKAKTLSRISNDPVFLFRGIFEFLKINQITIPGYTTFQEHIISVAISQENERLYSCLDLLLSERVLLLSLLDESESFYAITCLKKNPKNFKLAAIKEEVNHYGYLLPLYQMACRILPRLNLSKTAINYYASLVELYTVQSLNRINEKQTCLWLLCFVYKRYKLLVDNITTMFIYTGNQYKESVEEKAKELLVEDLLKPVNHSEQTAKALKFYYDPNVNDKQAFVDIKQEVNSFFPTPQIMDVVKSLEQKTKKYQNQFHWLAVDALSPTYKTPLRLLMKIITLNGNQYKNLQEAHQFLKTTLIQNGSLETTELFPLQFIQSDDLEFIKNGAILNTNRYEYDCYWRIATAINRSALYVTNSTRYNDLQDELLPDWAHQKKEVLQNLNNVFLNKGINAFIEEKVIPLDEKIEKLNEAIRSGKNDAVKVKKDKDESEFWTLPYTHKNKELNNPFYEQLPKISITNLLHAVNNTTGFINEFTHIKPHYAKSTRDEFSIFAMLVANGTNLGLTKMEALCDLSLSDLKNADNNYIRLSTLRAANDRISNATSKLSIFKHWNLLDDLLLASADGQKTKTERETLLSRNSPKYFGLGKGVVTYSLIANHVPINAKLIGANMHESHFLFDLFYNNTSIIKPNVLSTDTEGSNQLNFLLLHTIDKLFAPRYRRLSAKTQTIISYEDPKYFQDFLIKPHRSFNKKLVLEEADNSEHIIASLLSGEANQSNIVRKLSSSGYASRTKHALWEMNAVLMTHHLLDTISNLDFRQAIQGGLCRGEAYHQLKRSIQKANGHNFRGTSDIQMEVWSECARLLTNCVIYYNALILNALKEDSDQKGNHERSQKLSRLSPVAWTHLNFQGWYIFLSGNKMINFSEVVNNLLGAEF